MDFLILSPRGGGAERRVNVRHIVQFFPVDAGNEAAGTKLLLIYDNDLVVTETVGKIDIAIRKLNGKLIAA